MARTNALITLDLPQPPRSEQRSTGAQPYIGWDSLTVGPTTSGEHVTELRALQMATVFTCVSILAKSIGTLPLVVYKQTERGKIPVPDDPLQFLLGVQPNEDTPNAAAFWECYVAHLVLTGNAYAEISRNVYGDPVALWVLNPRSTQPYRDPATGKLTYRTSDGMPAGQYRILQPADVLHVPLFSHDGVLGLSPIANCREMLGASLSQDKFGAQFFANYATPSLALLTDHSVKPEDKGPMRADWEKLQGGDSRHRVAILDQGLKLEKISITPNEAQFLDSKRFSQAQIAALFGVPQHLLNSGDMVSRGSTEELQRQWLADGLQAPINRICQAIALKILPRSPGRASDYSVNFVKDLSGDTKAMAERIRTNMSTGIWTLNDGLEAQGLPTVEGGNIRTLPANFFAVDLETGKFLQPGTPTQNDETGNTLPTA